MKTIDLTARRNEIRAQLPDLSDQAFSALEAVVNWRNLLRGPVSQQKSLLSWYLEKMGRLPSETRVLRNATKTEFKGEAAFLEICQSIVDGKIEPNSFIQLDNRRLRKNYPELTTPQIRLLKAMIQKECCLGSLNIADFEKQFPFPITRHNFFGRFIAASGSDPLTAIRHLQITLPFFVKARSLLEGLSADKFRFLVVDVPDPSKTNDEGEKNPKGKDREEYRLSRESAIQVIEACICNASQFLGARVGNVELKVNPNLTLIHFPELLEADASHIDPKNKYQLAVELYNWLLIGDRTGEALNKRTLSTIEEETFKRDQKLLRQKNEELSRHRSQHPPKTARSHEIRRYEAKEKRLEDRIAELELSIEDKIERRKKLKPIIQVLESDPRIMSQVRKFREDICEARRGGKQIVFSFLSHSRQKSSHLFSKNLDRAFNAPNHLVVEGVQILRQSSFIFDSRSNINIQNHEQDRVPGFGSIYEGQLRDFRFHVGDLNHSLLVVLGGLLPKRQDPKLSLFVAKLLNILKTPGVSELSGVSNERQLKYSVQQNSGRQDPNALDYVSHILERLSSFPTEAIFSLLAAARIAGIREFPERCIQLGIERFQHPRSVYEQFATFCKSYEPNQLGALPSAFEDLATFIKYTSLGINANGMEQEVLQLAENLRSSGIVAIVDGTNYHPELAAEVMGEKVAEDVENTEERWGQYVRPAERLLNAFSRCLIEGSVPEELQGNSLVTVKKPSKEDKVMEQMLKKFFGITAGVTTDIATVNRVLSDLTAFDTNTIIVVDAQAIKDPDQYMRFIKLLRKYNLKVILRTREPFPGIPQVLVQPFMDHSIGTRLMKESESLRVTLGLDRPISKEVLDFTAGQVARLRTASGDPLNYALQTLRSAAENALLIANGRDVEITRQDVVAALAPIFHLPDSEQMRQRLNAIDEFARRAPMEVLGQAVAINLIAKRMKSHILGLRDPSRPLTLLLPGPTGVGKTELMIKFSKAADLPYFQVEGAEFSEEHTVSRLVGSPSGYVGPDKGILYQFLENNTSGLVFIDEIEKMHPAVYTALMNFFDKATLTAGNGETVSRPGMVIVGASNAGADRLHREMSEREIRDILAEAFVDRLGNKRPELVRRFEPVPMLAIEQEAFRDILRNSLLGIGTRYGFVNANLNLVDLDPVAIQLLYDASLEVCAFNEEALRKKKIGFADVSQGRSIDGDLFYDMRHITRAIDALAGESIQEVAESQYLSGAHLHRGQSRKMKLVGDLSNKRVILVDQE